MKMRFLMPLVFTFLVSFSWQQEAKANGRPTSIGTFVAKSTFVNLADASRHEFQPKGFAYLPPGTRFIAYSKTVKQRGIQRRLILTEDGLWGYIPDSTNHYWNPKRLSIFRTEEKLVVIRKRKPVTYKLSDEVEWNIKFTPSELYPFVREDDESVTVQLGKSKLPNLDADSTISVKISDRNLVRILDTATLQLVEPTLSAYSRSQLENVVGVQKACGTKQVRTLTVGGGAGFNLSKWFGFIKVQAEGENKTITDYGEQFNVARWYYKRSKLTSLHRVTKKQDCSTGKLNYSYVNPNGFEIEFRHDRADQNGFKFDKFSGRVLVTCADDYYRLSEYLERFEFESHEIPFVISRTAKFRNTHSASECEYD